MIINFKGKNYRINPEYTEALERISIDQIMEIKKKSEELGSKQLFITYLLVMNNIIHGLINTMDEKDLQDYYKDIEEDASQE